MRARTGPRSATERFGWLRAAALDLLVAQDCAGCGEHRGVVWCVGCAGGVQGGPLRIDLPGGVAARAAGLHRGALARAITAHKDAGRRPLVKPLGDLLAGSVAAALLDAGYPGAGDVWLVPVPARPSARRRRGEDSVSRLAERATHQLRRAAAPARTCHLLRHARTTADQVGLRAAQRRQNVAGSFLGAPPPAGWVVLVDDVYTTGATISAAIQALRSPPPIGAAAAAAPGSGPDPAGVRGQLLVATVTASPLSCGRG